METQIAFYEISFLFLLVSALGLLGQLLRQPLIVSLILAGLLAGFLNLGMGLGQIELLSEVGITLLLFLVGLKLDLSLIRSLGKVAVATGGGQIFFTSVLGFVLSLFLGFSVKASVFMAIALTFSSTIIIVKLLSDKKEIDSLHGRIAVGFLIVQDIFVVISIVTLSGLGVGQIKEEFIGLELALSLAVFILFIGIFIRYVSHLFYRFVAKSSELMVTVSLTLALAMASWTNDIGLGKELGGLLAGVMLASTPLRDSLSSRMASLRDFLLIFFFLELGMGLDLSALSANFFSSIILSLFVLIGNPIIVMWIMKKLGYTKRTGFLAGLTVAQISEFSLVFMAVGKDLNFLGPQEMSVVATVGLVTIAASTYMISYSHILYNHLEKWLSFFDPPHPQRENVIQKGIEYEALVIGLGRYGGKIADELREKGFIVLGVDFDPEVIKHWRSRGLMAHYFDISDPDFFETIRSFKPRWIIHTIHYPLFLMKDDPRIPFMSSLRQCGYSGKIALTVNSDKEAQNISELHPDYILNPFQADASAFVATYCRSIEQRPTLPHLNN